MFFEPINIRGRMWYVLNVAAHCEHQVANFLSHEGLEAYAPRFPPPPRTKIGSVRDRRARFVFPGYLFFRVPAGFARWDTIRWAPRVRRVLQQDGAPATVADDFVTQIRRRLIEGQLRAAAPRFKKGEPVVIERGPLTAVDAVFDCELDGPHRVQILIDMMQRSVPIRIDADDLRSAAL